VHGCYSAGQTARRLRQHAVVGPILRGLLPQNGRCWGVRSRCIFIHFSFPGCDLAPLWRGIFFSAHQFLFTTRAPCRNMIFESG
jgi:hypothetical protein